MLRAHITKFSLYITAKQVFQDFNEFIQLQFSRFQIYYLDEHDTNGFHVTKNNDVLLQCTTMTHSSERVMKGNTCYTGSVAYLSEDDRVEVRDISDARYSLFEPGKSFFGILKLGDIKMSN